MCLTKRTTAAPPRMETVVPPDTGFVRGRRNSGSSEFSTLSFTELYKWYLHKEPKFSPAGEAIEEESPVDTPSPSAASMSNTTPVEKNTLKL